MLVLRKLHLLLRLINVCVVAIEVAGAVARPEAGFVQRTGSRLSLDGKVFRWSGTNEYWLGLDENVDGVHYPTPFRIDDGLATAAGMGLQVVRAHTLGVSTGNPLSFEPQLGVFNDSALDAADYAIFRAQQLNLKLVVPLTDNYAYYHGGYHNWCDWLGLPRDAFYTNATAIAAFKDYIKHRLLHVNPYTGRAAVDEPAIMAWETGNELSFPFPPDDWTADIASFIKSLDPNHLVMDGSYGVRSGGLAAASVDIVSDHFYPVDTSRLLAGAQKAAASQIVYGAFEYGWSDGPFENVIAFLQAGLAEDAVSGLNFWSVFPHADNYGFVQHGDGFTVHFPGDATRMSDFVQIVHQSAVNISGGAVPTGIPAPDTAPLITLLTAWTDAEGPDAVRLAWRGVALSATYDIQTGSSATGPFHLLCEACATDDATPLNISSGVPVGEWVAVRGRGLANHTGPWSAAVQRLN